MFSDLHRPKIIYSVCYQNHRVLSTPLCERRRRILRDAIVIVDEIFSLNEAGPIRIFDSALDFIEWCAMMTHCYQWMSYAFIMCAICHIPLTTMATPMLHKMREINIEKKKWQTTIAPGPTSNNVVVTELRVA